MLRGYLVIEKEGSAVREVTIGDSLTLGRAGDCGLVIDDAAASRRHVEVFRRGDVFHVRDLGSTNGTLVNGSKVQEGVLSPGDRIHIGETVLRFEMEQVESVDPQVTDSTIFKRTIFGWKTSAEAVTVEGPTSESLLRAVYSVMNEIASNYEPCSLVDRILETTMNAIHAQRGAIFFSDYAAKSLAPCPICKKYHMITNDRLSHVDSEAIQVSKTVIHHVLAQGQSVLYTDADNENMPLSASIMSLQIRSIICTPLKGKYGNVGILYIDSSRPGHQYTNDDLLLATAVGNSAGLAIENAQMHLELIEKERMQQDIENAWTIQEGFLFRDWPEKAGQFEVYGEMRPAKTVGGDFYDFVQPDPEHIGILIGDVSGKGVPAALTMAQILAEFRVRCLTVKSPAKMVQALNAELYHRSKRGMFCTICYLTLELPTGKVLCANAGHHPILYSSGDRCEALAPASGPPVGVLKEGPWEDVLMHVKKGDLLTLYTDGIVEARSPSTWTAGQENLPEYGIEALTRCVRKFHRENPKRIVDAVNEDVIQYCKPGVPHDDCTLIAVRYTG